MGLWHQVVFREDGTASALPDWSSPPRRAPIRLRAAREGGLVPEERGKHRVIVIAELEYLLSAHGVALSASERRGPESSLPPDLVSVINGFRAEGLTSEAAYDKVAADRHVDPDYVRRRYLASRRRYPPTPLRTGARPLAEEPHGLDLLIWIKRIQSAEGVSFPMAARYAAEVRGWSPEKLVCKLEQFVCQLERDGRSDTDGNGHPTISRE
jgi:hypothetical protein